MRLFLLSLIAFGLTAQIYPPAQTSLPTASGANQPIISTGAGTAYVAGAALAPSTKYMSALNSSHFYVSASLGSDSYTGLLPAPNAGLTDGPFRTITKAQTAMQASGTNKTTILRNGTYTLGATLQFLYNDDGESWVAYPGESPVIDGAGTYGLLFQGTNTLDFEGLTIQNMAVGGGIFNGANTVIFRNNTFLNCNQNCISGSAATYVTFDSNIINGQSPGNPSGNTSTFYGALSLGYGSANNTVTNNLIANCQGSAIVFATGVSDPPSSNNIIDNNYLLNIETNVFDCGGIYIYDASHSATGNKITNNVINGVGGASFATNQTKAIYLDDLTSNTVVSGNLCRQCGSYGFQIHGGDHNTFSGNIFDLSSGSQLGFYQVSAVADDGMAANVFLKNIIYFAGSAPSSLYTSGINAGDALLSVHDNLYYSATAATIPNTTFVDATRVLANPQFVNPLYGNYNIPLTSSVFNAVGSGGIAFVPTAFSQATNAGASYSSASLGVASLTAANVLSGTQSLSASLGFSGTIPTIAAGASAGTAPTVSMVTGSTTNRGQINLTTGTATTTGGVLVTVTFTATPPNAVFCSIDPANAATAALAVGVVPYVSSGASTASFVITANGTALATSTAYKFGYSCF